MASRFAPWESRADVQAPAIICRAPSGSYYLWLHCEIVIPFCRRANAEYNRSLPEIHIRENSSIHS